MVSKSDEKEVYEYTGDKCWYCGDLLLHGLLGDATIDHVIPVSRGGDDSIWNLLPACISCNSSKGDKTLEEHRDYKFPAAPPIFGNLRKISMPGSIVSNTYGTIDKRFWGEKQGLLSIVRAPALPPENWNA